MVPSSSASFAAKVKPEMDDDGGGENNESLSVEKVDAYDPRPPYTCSQHKAHPPDTYCISMQYNASNTCNCNSCCVFLFVSDT
jgi:hypothetical protein